MEQKPIAIKPTGIHLERALRNAKLNTKLIKPSPVPEVPPWTITIHKVNLLLQKFKKYKTRCGNHQSYIFEIKEHSKVYFEVEKDQKKTLTTVVP